MLVVDPSRRQTKRCNPRRKKATKEGFFILSLSPVSYLTETGTVKLFGTPKTYSQAALMMRLAWPSALALTSAAVADCVSKPAGHTSSTASKLVAETLI